MFSHRICVERADRLFAEVERGAKRLEQLCQKRKEKIKEQQRIKALHTETTEVFRPSIFLFCHIGMFCATEQNFPPRTFEKKYLHFLSVFGHN